ncbi:cell wall elongation regulator TseB-like domain-containing protein [Paenibacillus jiagnxiensis]|uniref:cell wall elongation regulator TseB-like domain-containing protein n=1 Tax=Paenibacillus jiagnxiensis TaxID=3228926 RepID=UPI0033B89794
MKNRKTMIAYGVFIFILLLIAMYLYYSFVTQGPKQEESTAILKAKQTAGLVATDKTWKNVWANTYWVVEGTDAENRKMMVWVPFQSIKDGQDIPQQGTEGVHSELLQNGVSEEQMRTAITSANPDLEIVRLLPGVFNEEYVWQLFYKINNSYYYQFYKFADGSPVGTPFQLPNTLQ